VLIRKKNLWYGVVLHQLVNHNCFVKLAKHQGSIVVNDKVLIDMKYASEPINSAGEYMFTFTAQELVDHLQSASENHLWKHHMALICGAAEVVCLLNFKELSYAWKTYQEERYEARAGGFESMQLYLVPCGLKIAVAISGPKARDTRIPLFRIRESLFPDSLFKENQLKQLD
jgi:hypothetical protein